MEEPQELRPQGHDDDVVQDRRELQCGKHPQQRPFLLSRFGLRLGILWKAQGSKSIGEGSDFSFELTSLA